METEKTQLEDGFEKYREMGLLARESSHIEKDVILVPTCGVCERIRVEKTRANGTRYEIWIQNPELLANYMSLPKSDMKPSHTLCPVCKDTDDIINLIEKQIQEGSRKAYGHFINGDCNGR